MQTVALKPKRAEWTSMIAGLSLLCVAMLAAPVLCVPLALICPLLTCPLVGRKSEPFAWTTAFVPTAASLLARFDTIYSFGLLLIGLLPLMVTRFVPIKKRPGAKGMLMYVVAMVYALGCVVYVAGNALGGPLHVTLARALMDWVRASKHSQQILNRFVIAGLIPAPDGYDAQRSADFLMTALHQKQLLMSLRLAAETLIMQSLPSLFVQSCLLVGMFTSLRLERVHGVLLVVETKSPSEKITRVVAPPSFRLLALPRGMRRVVFALALTALVLMISANDATRMVGQMCFATFQTVFYLLGAAVLVFMYTRNDPEQRVIGGVIAAALYVTAPFILLMIGMADQAFHFRIPKKPKPD